MAYSDDYCDSEPPNATQYEAFTDKTKIIRDNKHNYNVFLKYKKPADYEHAKKMVKREFENARYMDGISTATNENISMLDGAMPETTRVVLWSIATFVIGVMAIAAAFIVRNSFNISITERIRQFGILSSIGARPRQIRAMVYKEAFTIGAVAIPLGVALGSAMSYAVVVLINKILIEEILGVEILFYISPRAFLLIFLVGIIIIILSAASPAIVAGRVSPIAAIRNNQDVKIKARKVRTSKITRRLWGIGGVIASKNLKRSRQKYRTTVVSIVLSVSVFIGIASFISYGYEIVKLCVGDIDGNVLITSSSLDLAKDVLSRTNVKEYSYFYHLPQVNGYNNAGELVHAPTLIVVSRDEFKAYMRRAGLLFADDTKTAIMVDKFKSHDYDGNIQYRRVSKAKEGDKIEIGYYDSENDEHYFTIEVTKLTGELPRGYTATIGYDYGVLYISEDNEVFKDGIPSGGTAEAYVLESGKGKAITKYIESEEFEEHKSSNMEWVDAYDVEEEFKIIRNLLLLFELVTYGFIFIVSAVGVTNIFNTISTNIATRAKEFAILKSIGMTNTEFNRMIRLESMLYTVRALSLGLSIGLIMNYGVWRFLYEAKVQVEFSVPWLPVLICIFSVSAMIAIIMRYSVSKTKRQNIIETIRKESF